MRTEQSIDSGRELNPRAWICSEKLFADRHVQHASQYSELLMNRRGLQQVLFDNPLSGFNLYTLLEPVAEVSLYLVGVRSASLVFSNTALKCVSARWFTSWVFCARNGGIEKFFK